jgi:hypothetical protein
MATGNGENLRVRSTGTPADLPRRVAPIAGLGAPQVLGSGGLTRSGGRTSPECDQ